jgi:serine/threonine-protein kinase
LDLAQRYVVEREIARGGMGQVLLAYDQDLRRRVALKVLPPGAESVPRREWFLDEARATAQLEHPNIGPVYDLGADAAGRPFFTMKWIRGRNLKQLLGRGGERLSLLRKLRILEQVAMAVHFAASRGIVHCDLKPANVMIGDYGEVLVVDWGLAKATATPPSRARALLPRTQRSRASRAVPGGAVRGSVAYMAPEQACGRTEEIDHRTDVFGLGAILYEVLTGAPPYPEESYAHALERAQRCEVVPPRERARQRDVPAPLEAICLKAMACRRDERFADAREFHDALEAFAERQIDAERRAAEARRLLNAAEKLARQERRAFREEERLRGREARLKARLHDHDPERRKRGLWQLKERCARLREDADRLFSRTTAAYLAVLNVEPDHREARAALADRFYARLLAAETAQDPELARFYSDLITQYHDGRYALELQGSGRLRLDTDPPAALVWLHRFREQGPLLVAGAAERLGRSPVDHTLPQGSYLAVLRRRGFHEARYPFVIRRGGDHEAKVRLCPLGSIPAGFVQITAGTSIVGSRSDDFLCLPRREVVVDEFFAGEFPVTFGEYAAFLDDRFTQDAPDLPEYLPQFGKEAYIEKIRGRWTPIPKLDPRMPVFSLPHRAMRAYCRWLGRRLGRKVRLLDEVKWERCARGADGRVFPWGNGFDWALCKGGLSRRGKPFPEPAGTFPRDVSVFGVRDLAGSVREVCAGRYGEIYRPCRGGSWFSPSPLAFRADCRTLQREGNRATDIGFRVCYSVT